VQGLSAINFFVLRIETEIVYARTAWGLCPQITTDGWGPYVPAINATFKDSVDYAQLVKIYGDLPAVREGYAPSRMWSRYPRSLPGILTRSSCQLPHRAPEPNNSHDESEVYEIDQRFQQEAVAPESCRCVALRFLQFLRRAFDPESHYGDGSGDYGPCVGIGRTSSLGVSSTA